MLPHRREDIVRLIHFYIDIITGLAGRQKKEDILACKSGIDSRYRSVYD